MYKSATVIAAAIAFGTLAMAPANAAPLGAGISGLQQSMISQSPDNQLVHKTGKKGKFAAGFMIGLGTAAAIGAGGYGYSYYGEYGSHRRMCRRLRRSCWNGNGNACWKFDRRC